MLNFWLVVCLSHLQFHCEAFNFFNRDEVTPINYLEHDDSVCHWCVWFLSFPIINPTGWCSFLHCSTSVTDWRMCYLMVDLHARVFSIPLYLMMLSGWCLMWMASLSLTGAPVTIIIELLNLEKDKKVTCLITHMFRDCKCYVFQGQGGSSKGGGEGC